MRQAFDFAERADAELRRLHRRDKAFGADIFVDPAWLILLNLFAAFERGKEMSMMKACRAGNVPMSTALRYAHALIERGLVARESDQRDKRKSLVTITEPTRMKMRQWLEQGYGSEG